MKPLVFYPPKAHEKAITESLETVGKRDDKKEKDTPHSLPGFQKRTKKAFRKISSAFGRKY